jgi:hypothetical protein
LLQLEESVQTLICLMQRIFIIIRKLCKFKMTVHHQKIVGHLLVEVDKFA